MKSMEFKHWMAKRVVAFEDQKGSHLKLFCQDDNLFCRYTARNWARVSSRSSTGSMLR